MEKSNGKTFKKQFAVLLAATLILSCIPAAWAAEEAAPQNVLDLDAVQHRVSYLGPAGTYTEEATRFFFESAKEFIPKATVEEAIADVTEGRTEYAVIPQENTLGGAVTNDVDALIVQEGGFLLVEVLLPISQTLM